MPRRHPRFWAVSASLLLTVSVGCGETVIPKLEGDALNPDASRAPIVTLDAILFEDGPLSESGRDEVARQLIVVADVASKDPANTIAMVHGRELRQLADIAKRTRVGSPLLNSPLRMQWFRIRTSLFADAWWFRRSSRDPIERVEPDAPAASASTAPSAERRSGLESALFSVGGLIAKARRDLSNSSDREAHRQFVAEVEREMVLNEVRIGPQPPGSGPDAAYGDAYRSAVESMRSMKALAGLADGTPASTRESLIKQAEDHRARALKALSEIR